MHIVHTCMCTLTMSCMDKMYTPQLVVATAIQERVCKIRLCCGIYNNVMYMHCQHSQHSKLPHTNNHPLPSVVELVYMYIYYNMLFHNNLLAVQKTKFLRQHSASQSPVYMYRYFSTHSHTCVHTLGFQI